MIPIVFSYFLSTEAAEQAMTESRIQSQMDQAAQPQLEVTDSTSRGFDLRCGTVFDSSVCNQLELGLLSS